MAGDTRGSLDGSNAGYADTFVRKYDGAGNLLWTRQLGTDSNEEGSSVSVDALGNVYLLGATGGVFPGNSAESGQAFLGKYSPSGNLLWVRQFGTNSYDGRSVSTDNLGHAYVVGGTHPATFGNDTTDVFIAKIGNVPEPSTMLLTVAGLAVGLLCRRKTASHIRV